MCNYRRTVLLIISLLSICYSYAYDFVVDGIYYNILSENNVEVTYKALWSVENSIYKGNIVIPDKTTFNDISYNVTSIGDSAFYFSNITSITLPITITSIGNHSFQECKSLNSVILPNSVTSIGVASFEGCSIKTIELSKSLTSIGEWAFGFCKYLKKITIPESVTSLPNSAFGYCI